ncbi:MULTISPECIES: site-specific integrase [Pseudomonas]|uniref:Site-specific recombinase XerC n=1 Tax=Pseudomonas lutea TaxID=243924 RepID=A0A9X8QLR8_9PSED|nr:MULTISPECIES: site-specific integrase [Pseudomonas]SER37611.1 Site-specific recombinase XerC [Pseudomonas lutea]
MATKRKRGNRWEFIIRRKHLLGQPLSFSFATEREGAEWCARTEAELDKGRIPAEVKARLGAATLGAVIEGYIEAVAMPESDQALLHGIERQQGALKLDELTYEWAEQWVAGMKHERVLAPVTIRHYVGALARCLDWSVKRGGLAGNPLRELPKRYASYNAADGRVLARKGKAARTDAPRDRRLDAKEEESVHEILDGETATGRQRPLVLPHRDYLEALFKLALETAMRLREMYTLSPNQVDMARRTVYLNQTKNGDKRQIPLSSVAMQVMGELLERHEGSDDAPLFPWWDGDLSAKSLKRTTARISAQFARIFEAAECADLHFHDLRHEAVCRLFERTTMDAVLISRITGHRDPRLLARYASLRGSDLARYIW